MQIVKELGHTMKNEILVYLAQQTKLYEQVNEQIGMSGELASDFRDELLMSSGEANKWGISLNEVAETVGKIDRQSGKFKLLNQDTIREMSLAR